MHVIFEHVGAAVWPECFASLRRGGRFINSGVTAGHRVELHLGQLWTRELTLMGTTMRPRDDMPAVMTLVRGGKLRGVVSEVLPLREAARAHELMERSEFFGKIVLVPRPSPGLRPPSPRGRGFVSLWPPLPLERVGVRATS